MYDGFTGEEELEVPDSFVYSVISSAVKEKVFQLLVVSQIAKPGGLHLRQGVIIINNEKSTDINGTLLIRDAFSYYKRIKYPTFSFLSFQDVYSWFVNNDLLLKVEPTSKLQIALNAFTFLFDNNLSSEIELIYTCMALEALYTKGNTNITEQLNDKIQVYLGQVSDYKKSIKNMYDFRSRFLHGSLPIKPIDCDTSIWTVHDRGIGEATNLSKMILIATF